MKRSFIGKGDDQGHGGWYRHPNEDDGEGEKLEGRHFIAGWADAGKTLSEMVRVVVTWRRPWKAWTRDPSPSID
jgi:hypothetical protein